MKPLKLGPLDGHRFRDGEEGIVIHLGGDDLVAVYYESDAAYWFDRDLSGDIRRLDADDRLLFEALTEDYAHVQAEVGVYGGELRLSWWRAGVEFEAVGVG